jgi:hypothetical protein
VESVVMVRRLPSWIGFIGAPSLVRAATRRGAAGTFKDTRHLKNGR